jgi:hypothetical protein
MGTASSTDKQRKWPPGFSKHDQERFTQRRVKRKFIERLVKHGQGRAQEIAQDVVRDEEKLATVMNSLTEIPDLYDPQNRHIFAKMDDSRYNALRNRVDQLWLIQRQVRRPTCLVGISLYATCSRSNRPSD